MPKRRPLFATLFLAALLGTSGGSFAHDDAKGIVKERMQSMKTMGKATKQLAAVLKAGDVPKSELILSTAETLIDECGQMERLFPDTHESRASKVSEALDTVWSDREAFLTSANQLIEHAETLKAAATEPVDVAAVTMAFREVAGTCKSCHKEFRED